MDAESLATSNEYGTLDGVLYPISKYEELQDWLMDADACPTEWPELLRIRREHPNYTPKQPSLLALDP